MKRLLSTRYGFFGAACLVCLVMSVLVQPQHRWVAFGAGALYALLSALFFLEEATRDARLKPSSRRADPRAS